VLTHFIVAADVARSRDFYVGVLGGRVVLDGEPSRACACMTCATPPAPWPPPPALATLADSAPLPVEIRDAAPGRCPAAVETAAYLLVAEALDDAAGRGAQTIRAEHPQVGVLVLSQYVEPSYAMRLIQEHPERVGYLLKERVFDIATVVDALRRIVDGETVIDPTIVPRLVGRRRRQDPLADLSQREREVLGLIAEGMSNRAIAARLVVTERTVEAHVTQIFQKLHLPESPDQHRRVLAVLAFLRA
jgi:DNA-binding NarL/FixJ family response regulator